ncbi:TatD family hydrolase [Aurantivibrio plasticivorans]
MDFIDSHCHLDFSKFDLDRDQIMEACLATGISHIVLPGVNPAQWRSLQDLAKTNPMLSFAVGIHPWWLDKIDIVNPEAKALVSWLKPQCDFYIQDKHCVAIGEAGLDKLVDISMAVQVEYLKAQIRIANCFEKPLILHCVKAHNEMLQLLSEEPVARGGVIHGFSGSAALARQYIDKGFLIGVGGTITYSRASKTRSAIAALPLQAILLETDAPDMPLCGHQGERNSPLQLIEVAHALAELKNITLAEVGEQTTENARNLFALSK